MTRPRIVCLLLVACLAACTPVAPAPTAAPTALLPTALPPTAPPPTVTPPPAAVTLEVPTGNPPVLDGTMSPGEWDAAHIEKMSDGSELFLMHNGGYLYLAMRNRQPNLDIIGSLCLDRGDEVAILHSSAALGTAVYRAAGDAWERVQAFVWRARQTDNGAAAQAAREEFLESDGWVASLAVMGVPEETEYKIVMPAGGVRLAAVFNQLYARYVAYWPAGLTDSCATLALVQGNEVDALRFAPESWALLTPSSAPPPPTAVATALPALDGRGDGVLAYYSERDGNAEIYLMNADGSAERRLTFNEADDYSPAWSPDGERIAFESDRNDPNPVRCFPNCTYDLYVMNADGTGERQLTDTPYISETNADWSPDGTQIMYDADVGGDGNGEIYVLNVEDALVSAAEPKRLTDGKSDDRFADWSPDGTQIAFSSKRDGNWEIYVMNADGTDPRRMTDNAVNDFFPDWSPDGTQIAYFVMPANLAARGQDLYIMNADGSDARQLTDTQPIVDEDPAWSPDGKRLAFQSDRDGNFEIYLINVDGTNEQRLTTNHTQEYWPAWRPVAVPPPAAAAVPANSTGLSGPYLGQQTPGSSPVRFASALIKGNLHTSPTFTPDGKEAYWSMQGAQIYTTRLENGYWTQPEPVAFSASMTDYRDPFISPSGDRLFFLSKGEIPNSGLPEKENIWYVERTGSAWGEPQPLGVEVNSLELHWQVSVNSLGDIYFTSRNTGCEDIYFSRYLDGRYAKPERLGEAVNTDDLCETTPYIAPDGSYLIFSRWDLNNGNSPTRLYISYAGQDGGWTKAVLIEQVAYGLCPLVSPDGKYLFFLSSPQGVSWMSTEVVERLEPGT